MDEFVNALLSGGPSLCIPPEDDWYAPLLGDWDFDYSEPGPGGRRLKGEWLFRRVLDGMAIEDLFICPSRASRHDSPQPDAEYGAALRMYCPAARCYDMTYVCSKYTRRLEVRRQDGQIVCTVLPEGREKWVFSEITADAFHWRNVAVQPDGSWRTNCEVEARRRRDG